jgi:hypothetical protein
MAHPDPGVLAWASAALGTEVAAMTLASPPDMGWFAESMAAQGRPDLTREVMLKRRDAFLTAALSQLETTG